QRIAEEDIEAVAEFALRHRRRENPPSAPASNPAGAAQGESSPAQGQGQWGELPAQVLPVGARREIPSWPKKP
ncbi:magnesium chelatase, partial [Pseudomonas gingeri]|nr:magnesium chelatase [Pseudomonas gingeri]